MANRFSSVICWLVLVVVFTLEGCEQRYRKDVSAYEQVVDPNLLVDPNFVVPEYVSRAIEATGGRQAWMRTKKIALDCRVTFYQDDGSFYLTEQCHEIYPWSNSIRISAEEPQGTFVRQLSNGVLRVWKGTEQVDRLPIAGLDHDFAEAMLSVTTAPVRFFDKQTEFAKGTQPVKIEGQWYYPIIRIVRPINGEPSVQGRGKTKAVFYQNRDTSVIDLVWFAAKAGAEFESAGIMVHGYDYREVKRNGVWLPGKVEIFVTDASGAHRQRLAVIDFH